MDVGPADPGRVNGDERLARSGRGVGRIVCIGTDADSSREAADLASSLAGVSGMPLAWATVGLHPHEAKQGVEGVVILDGKLPHAVLIELLTDHGAGTLITR